MSSTFTWQLVLQLLCKCVRFLVCDILKVRAQMHSLLHDHCNELHCDTISDTMFEKLAYLLYKIAAIQIKDELYLYGHRCIF